jgi:hypothetical protein
MKDNKNKWLRYFNIIMGIPNKKQKASRFSVDSEDAYIHAEPAGRQIRALRADEINGEWQLKADFQNTTPVIQNCDHSF